MSRLVEGESGGGGETEGARRGGEGRSGQENGGERETLSGERDGRSGGSFGRVGGDAPAVMPSLGSQFQDMYIKKGVEPEISESGRTPAVLDDSGMSDPDTGTCC